LPYFHPPINTYQEIPINVYAARLRPAISEKVVMFA